MNLRNRGRLVRKSDGVQFDIGDTLAIGSEKYTLLGWRAPHKPSSSGRVQVREHGASFDRELFPHVFNLEIVDYE